MFLSSLGEKITDVASEHIDMLDSFVLQLFKLRDDTLRAARLDKLKKLRSTVKDLRLLPPSKEALRQHIYCASYQALRKADSKVHFQPLLTTSQS